jgi:PAS domain S-box-containing protein
MQSFACSSKLLAATLSSEALITSLSSGAEQFTGYSAQELAGRPVAQILADHSALEVPHILETAREWGYWQGEIIHRSRGGKQLIARGAVSLLAGKQNHTAGYLLISDLNKAPVLNDRENSIVTEVAAALRTVTHDLNNPLAVMMGFAQLLLLNQNCQGTMRGDIEKLYSELMRVIQVVEQLHAYALSLYKQPQQDQASSVAVQ